MANDFTQEGWEDYLRLHVREFRATDDDLRSYTLAAIRGLTASDGSLDEIRAALSALDRVMLDPILPAPTAA